MATQIGFARIIIDYMIGHFKLFVQRNLFFFSLSPNLLSPAPFVLDTAGSGMGVAGDEDYGFAAVLKSGLEEQWCVQDECFWASLLSILLYYLSALSDD